MMPTGKLLTLLFLMENAIKSLTKGVPRSFCLSSTIMSFLMQRNFLQSALSVLLGTLVAGVTAGQIQAAPASSLPIPIRVPPGFTAQVFAYITAPTNMRFDSVGRLWVTALDSTDVLSLPNGGVYMMQDTNGDGVADVQTTFASGLRVPLGLEFQGTSILVSVRGKILKLTDTNSDGTADAYQVLIDH